jgi:hypothetical protein
MARLLGMLWVLSSLPVGTPKFPVYVSQKKLSSRVCKIVNILKWQWSKLIGAANCGLHVLKIMSNQYHSKSREHTLKLVHMERIPSLS